MKNHNMPSKSSEGVERPQKDRNYILVFCHLEMLRSSTSPELHITQVYLLIVFVTSACFHFWQLAATTSRRNIGVFLPVAPPGGKILLKYRIPLAYASLELIIVCLGLTDYLDNYKMSTPLLQTLHMTRYHIPCL